MSLGDSLTKRVDPSSHHQAGGTQQKGRLELEDDFYFANSERYPSFLFFGFMGGFVVVVVFVVTGTWLHGLCLGRALWS